MMTDPTELDLAEMVSRADDYARAYVEALQGQPNRMPDIAHQIIADIPALAARVRELEAERDKALSLQAYTYGIARKAHDRAEAADARATAAEAVVARVEAVADVWEGWAVRRSTPRIDAFRDAAEMLRAALAPTTTEGSEG